MEQRKHIIDINADVGEGIGSDADIMPYITSCSVAAGGHAGDAVTMRETIQLAKKHGVHVGPHPSFPDRDNFGRKLVTMTKSELFESVFQQLLRFYAIAEEENVSIHHIKLHGALYNYAAKDAPTADAVVEAIIASEIRPLFYVPYNSVLHRKAENLIPVAFEGFIDRKYTDDGSLVSRNQENALIEEASEAWEQFKSMVISQSVKSISGNEVRIVANTFCIHGDHTKAVEFLQYIHSQLPKHQISLVQ